MLPIERGVSGFMYKYFLHDAAVNVLFPLVRVNQDPASPGFVAAIYGHLRGRGQQNCRQLPQGRSVRLDFRLCGLLAAEFRIDAEFHLVSTVPYIEQVGIDRNGRQESL